MHQRWITIAGLWAWIAVAAVLSASAEVAVTVRKTPGGPQICVDGQPVPPRMFFGTRGGGLLHVTEPNRWQSASFEFTPANDVPGRGTLHFRFPKEPARFDLREVRIVDTATGADVLPVGSFATPEAFAKTWNVWPPGAANTVGTVEIADGVAHVALRKPTAGTWPDFHLHTNIQLKLVKERTYRCTFEVKCSQRSTLMPAVYCVEGGVWNPIGGPAGPFLPQVELARDAGIRLISTSMPTCWQPPEEPQDWEPIDAVMRQIIEVHPEALIVPRVSANAPSWWLERHPEARMMFEDGKPGRLSTVSSRPYRRDVSVQLEKLCRHLVEAFPDHFAGIHPAGQNSAEWFYDESWGPVMSGYEPPTRDAWQAWLAALGEPGAETAEVPAAKLRHAAPFGYLRDPARERELILFNRFWQQEMADTVVELAAACRRGTGGKKLVVFFYGYLFEFPPLRNGAPYAGHYALSRVLDSPDIDVLCSPISYFDRQWQGTGASMTAAESVIMHDKLWLNEDDTRTYLAATGSFGGVENLEQTQAVMLRNTAQAGIRGFGTWWMDLPGQGWFADARIWDVQRSLEPLERAMLHRTKPFTPEIAVIIDEEGMIHLTGGSGVMARPLVYEARAAFGRSGAPYGQYMLRDVLAGRVPSKLQVLLSAWSLSPEQRRQLRASRTDGTTRVWCYAPGYLLPNQADVAAMRELTGFDHRALDLETAVASPTESGKALGIGAAWGPPAHIEPLFAADASPSDDVLAIFSDGSPAVVVRRGRKGTDVFVGVPGWTSQLTRALAKLAGVHLYTTVDANVWAAEDYLAIHTMSDGPLEVDTGASATVEDVVRGTPLGSGPILSLDTKAGDTWLLKIR